jgi:hypothetical protein
MKIIIKEPKKNQKSSEFPVKRIWTEDVENKCSSPLIVVFFTPESGIIVQGTAGFGIGYFSGKWPYYNSDNWLPYEGEITITI